MIFPHIRGLREDRDLKQKNIAEYLSIDQSTYSDYENGKINIPVEVIIKLANFYNTTTDYILGITNDISLNKRN